MAFLDKLFTGADEFNSPRLKRQRAELEEADEKNMRMLRDSVDE